MATATQSRRIDVPTERIAHAVFLGVFFAPVAGAFTGTLAEAIRYWNAEPGGTWLAPILMGLTEGFVRGGVTGLLLGIFNGWLLSAMSFGRATGVFFIAMLFSSSLGAILQTIFGPMFPPGTINVSPLVAFLAWAAGNSLIGVVLLFDRRAARSKAR